MNDLISLDDSNNTSFDLEDFDPLNQNARPLPPLSKAFSCSSGASFVTAASTFSHLNVSDPPVPTPRAKREVHQLRR